MASAVGSPIQYRSEIDGLRAIAILPVIGFHAGLPGLSGGFVGVDVFFVISGYLITAILLADLQAGRFSILHFYERRARRILPALSVVLLACLPFAWAWMTPEQLSAFSQGLVATALFASNGLFWLKSGYFDSSAHFNPLLHTWSLAVEEQFYLLFPPMLLLIWRGARRHLALILAVLALASFALCLWSVAAAPSAGFYLAPFRAWELLAGALCAVALAPGTGPLKRGAAGQAGALAGLGLIGAGLVLITPETPFPSAWTLLPVCGTVLIILFAAPRTLCGRMLSLGPLVAIGLISYSAYLIHQPLLAFATLRWGGTPPLALTAGLGALSLPLAWLCRRWVELPFLRPAQTQSVGRLRRRHVLGLSGGVLAAWVAVGMAGVLSDGAAARFPQIAALNRAAAIPAQDPPCHFTAGFDPGAARRCLADAPAPVVLVGDSHVYAIRTAFHDSARIRGLTPVSFHHNGCFPIPGTVRLPATLPENRSCAAFVADVHAVLDQTRAPVVIFTRWPLNLDGSRFDNHEGGVEPGGAVRTALSGGVEPANPAALADHAFDHLVSLADRHPLIVLGPFPEAGWNVPARVAARLRQNDAAPVLSVARSRIEARNRTTEILLSRLRAAGVAVIPLEPMFCDTAIPGRCVHYADGRVYYSDDDHPAPAAAHLIAERIFHDPHLSRSTAGRNPA